MSKTTEFAPKVELDDLLYMQDIRLITKDERRQIKGIIKVLTTPDPVRKVVSLDTIDESDISRMWH